MPTSVSNHRWQFQTPDPQTKAILDAAKWFCADLATGQSAYWISFLGNSGTGKTHLAKAVADWFKHHILGQKFLVRPNLIGTKDYRLRTWAAMMKKLYDHEYEGFEEVCKETLLVIDDFGAVHDPSGFGVSKFLDVLNWRQGRWTVITSNLTMEQIGNMDTRIASRLIREGSKVIEMSCPDFSLRNNGKVTI